MGQFQAQRFFSGIGNQPAAIEARLGRGAAIPVFGSYEVKCFVRQFNAGLPGAESQVAGLRQIGSQRIGLGLGQIVVAFGAKMYLQRVGGLGGLPVGGATGQGKRRSEEHTSELQSLMRISYAVFCLKKKKTIISKSPSNTARIPYHIK